MACRLDRDGRFASVDPAFAALLGYEADELVGRSYLDVTHPEDVPASESFVDLARTRARSGARLEKRYLAKDGRVVHGRVSWRVERPPGGRESLVATVAAARPEDVQAREDRLLRLDAFRRSLLDLVREALTAPDPEAFYGLLLARAVEVIPGAESGAMLLRDATDDYGFVAAVGYDLEKLAAVRFPAWLAGFEHPEGDPEPRVVIRPRPTPAELGPEAVRVLAEHGHEGRLAAVLVVPLLVGGRIRAFLTLDALEREDVFDEASIEMARVFTGVAAGLLQRFDLEAELHALAYRDGLTGLANRAAFEAELASRVEAGSRGPWAVLYLDLDNLKPVNDSFGHAAGDEVVRAVAERLVAALPAAAVAARLGGDEFAVALDGGEDEAIRRSRALLAELQHPVPVAGHAVVVSASVGVAVFPDHGTSEAELLRRADVAMFHARTRPGTDAVATFVPAMEAAPMERLLLEEALRTALDRREFELHYQPRVAAADGRIVGVEALVRWRHPERGLVPPGLFVPLAESTSLIHPLGRCILEEAVAEACRWREAGYPPVRLAVNLSPRQLERSDLVDEIAEVLGASGLPAGSLEVEVLESVAMSDVRSNAARLAALARLGVRVALDDFGIGHSSLAYLRELPAHSLKIDRTFLTGLAVDDPNRAIMGAIVLVGRALGLTVVAEGVETREQWDAVREIGVDEVQGYLLARPRPAEGVRELLAQGALVPDADAG
jgi:diguanylate cyclase (GGDEF)-like protein/PAS domain S-box-containing protein